MKLHHTVLSILLLLFIGCSSFPCHSQDFTGPWIIIQAKRIDGSRIIDPNRFFVHFEYSFKKSSTVSIDSSYFSRQTSTSDIKFIDSRHAANSWKEMELVSDSILIITEKHTEDEMDRKNRYVYLRKDRYLNFLKSTDHFIVEKDSTILVNSYIFPNHDFRKNNSTFTHYLYTRVNPAVGAVTGYFTVNKNRDVVDVEMVESRGFDQWDRLVAALKKTSGEWELPIAGYSYKIPFTLAVTEGGNDVDIRFKLNDFSWLAADHLGQSGEQVRLKQSFYDKASALAKNGSYEKAAEAFTKCIELDSLFLDAYYSRAFSYYQIGQQDKACQDWKYLKDLDQMAAIQLYTQHCKK